jgi:hypothetical protein
MTEPSISQFFRAIKQASAARAAKDSPEFLCALETLAELYAKARPDDPSTAKVIRQFVERTDKLRLLKERQILSE